MDRSYAKIKVTANGPYEVSNVQDIRLYAIKPDRGGGFGRICSGTEVYCR